MYFIRWVWKTALKEALSICGAFSKNTEILATLGNVQKHERIVLFCKFSSQHQFLNKKILHHQKMGNGWRRQVSILYRSTGLENQKSKVLSISSSTG